MRCRSPSSAIVLSSVLLADVAWGLDAVEELVACLFALEERTQ